MSLFSEKYAWEREEIAKLIIRVIRQSYNAFPSDTDLNHSYPFHEALVGPALDTSNRDHHLSANDIATANWLSYVDRVIDEEFLTELAAVLAVGTERVFRAPQITVPQLTSISEIMSSLSFDMEPPDNKLESALITQSSFGKRVDVLESSRLRIHVFIESDSTVDTIRFIPSAIDDETAYKEKRLLLISKAFTTIMRPAKTVRCYVGVPFDHLHAETHGRDKSAFVRSNPTSVKRYFAPGEILFADELWDHLSGFEDTMSQILRLASDISSSDFMRRFDLISNPHNARDQRKRYLSALYSWHLHGEAHLVELSDLLDELGITRRCIRIVRNQLVFSDGPDSYGEYNRYRYTFLSDALKGANAEQAGLISEVTGGPEN